MFLAAAGAGEVVLIMVLAESHLKHSSLEQLYCMVERSSTVDAGWSSVHNIYKRPHHLCQGIFNKVSSNQAVAHTMRRPSSAVIVLSSHFSRMERICCYLERKSHFWRTMHVVYNTRGVSSKNHFSVSRYSGHEVDLIGVGVLAR